MRLANIIFTVLNSIFRISKSGLSTLLISLIYITASANSQIGIPTGLCTNDLYQCDPETSKRWDLFISSQGIKINQKNFLSTGICSKNGHDNHEIYVLLGLSKQHAGTYFDAKFSFYNDLRDYKNFKQSNLLMIFPEINDIDNLLRLSDSHAYIDYSDTAPFRYWLRHHAQTNKILMVAYFGYKDTFLCEFVY